MRIGFIADGSYDDIAGLSVRRLAWHAVIGTGGREEGGPLLVGQFRNPQIVKIEVASDTLRSLQF